MLKRNDLDVVNLADVEDHLDVCVQSRIVLIHLCKEDKRGNAWTGTADVMYPRGQTH